jgi:hypothetical protein
MILPKLKREAGLIWQDMLAGWRVALANKVMIGFAVAYLLISIFAMAHFLKSSMLGDLYYRATFQSVYNGTAWKPFVYRVLVPQTVRMVVDVTPDVVERSVNSMIWKAKTGNEFVRLKNVLPWFFTLFPDPASVYPRVVTILLLYGCLWGYVFLLYKLGRELFPEKRAIALFAPVFGMLAISSFSQPQQYLYDIPVLMLSTGCYYAMFTQRLKLYLFFFTLACLNKETSLFILAFFTLWFCNRLPTRVFMPLWGAQCFIAFMIKLVVTFAYLHNAGFFLEDGLFRVLNMDVLTRSHLFRIYSIILLFFVLTHRWTEKPLFLKYVFWILPLIYGTFIFYGWPNEYRIYFDVMPLLVLLGTHTLVGAGGIADSPLFARMGRERQA